MVKANDDNVCGSFNSQQQDESCSCSDIPKQDSECEDRQHSEEPGKISEQESAKLPTEEIEDINEIIDQKEKQIEDYKVRWVRAKADFDNYRKRTQKEIREIHMYAAEEFIKDILPVMDNFERALDSIEDKSGAVYQGVEMIYQQLKNVLANYGVKEIEALGKTFDPRYHEAAMRVNSEEYDDETVVEVFQKGYTYHSRVIRPSMVKVAKNSGSDFK